MQDLIAHLDQYITIFYHSFSTLILAYLPLGFIGIWRWSVWTIKEVIAFFYKPDKTNFVGSVSIITPVYNEDPIVFRNALKSWKENNPFEIIAIIDYVDEQSIQIFKEFSKTFVSSHLIVTKKPGKRAALADGILAAKGDFVALVDSDTLWSPDLMKHALSPFHDQLVGGVGTRQNVLLPKSLSQKIFDIQLDSRYFDELPFLAASGDALTCLSGRTAFYRRSVVTPLVPGLINETFWGRPVISGDDKCLTYLVEKNGWKLRYQHTAVVYTPGVDSLSAFYKQRLRWSRNSWRADLKALWEGWVWRHPALAFHLIDRCIQPFTLLIGPTYLIVSLLMRQWLVALTLVAWWHLSRFVKIFPHLRRRPQDVSVLPMYILTNFISGGIIRLYSLFTLNTQGWITRWDSNRLARYGFIQKAPAYAFTSSFLLMMGFAVFALHNPINHSVSAPRTEESYIFSQNLEAKTPSDVLGSRDDTTEYNSLLIRHEIVSGDTIYALAKSYQVSPASIIAVNKHLLARSDTLRIGMVLSIPTKTFPIPAEYTITAGDDIPKRQVTYDATTNTIILKGRGHVFNLSDILREIGAEHIKQTQPGEWILSSNIDVRGGAVLRLQAPEVKWLKMASNSTGYVSIQTQAGVILVKGSKITSWDESIHAVDENHTDGRSYILAKYPSRMDFYDAEIAYLGFDKEVSSNATTYGVSWKNLRRDSDQYVVTGEVINSSFHHNWIGAYISGGTDMRFERNSFTDNISHGTVIQDNSSRIIYQNNKVVSNKQDGLLVQNNSIYNTITLNSLVNNGRGGVMLRTDSNDNKITTNIIYGNELGVSIIDSDKNSLSTNQIYQNRTGISLRGNSGSNVITENELYQQDSSALYSTDESTDNLFQQNKLYTNPVAIDITSSTNTIVLNEIQNNGIGVRFSQNAQNNLVSDNTLSQNTEYGIFSETTAGSRNVIGENNYRSNHSDFAQK
ncbi:glycosyltransferase [candidate division WWE3 bacterium]|nr:glycosyltransferase [candidate division WWE3 bacterium]